MLRTTATATLLVVVVVVIALTAAVSARKLHEGIGAPTTTTEAPCPNSEQHCRNQPGYPSTGCYNPKDQGCCGRYADDCFSPQVYNSTTHECCLPNYGCEYAGSPQLCKKGDKCCSARHGVLCAGPTEQCCGSMGEPGVCPQNAVCCQGYWGSTCCDATVGETCCQSSGSEPQATCCSSSQVCNRDTGMCETKTACNIEAGTTVVKGELSSSGFWNVSTCCENCGLRGGALCAAAEASTQNGKSYCTLWATVTSTAKATGFSILRPNKK